MRVPKLGFGQPAQSDAQDQSKRGVAFYKQQIQQMFKKLEDENTDLKLTSLFSSYQ